MLAVFKMLPTVTSEPLELTFVGIGCCKRTELCGLNGFNPRNLIACMYITRSESSLDI